VNGSQHTYPTLEGTDLSLDRLKNDTLLTSSGGWPGLKSSLSVQDILTRTGVVHELSDLLIPRSVDLTVQKLVTAAKASTMTSIITRAGMGWVLNATEPPADSPWAGRGLENAGWTLLCPTDQAFDQYNLTLMFADTELLQMIVYQHLIPNPPAQGLLADASLNRNRPLALDNFAKYSTLRSTSSDYGDIVFRLQDDEDGKGQHYVVGVSGARGTSGQKDRAKVISWGRSTSGPGTGGVITIDGVILPYNPPWWIEYGGPGVVGAIGIIAIVGFFYGINVLWRRDTTEATYEPVGGFTEEDD
jgi:solute carrier family 25 (mitochondrial carnitine/acylcarnitine transporter), member 20/29